MNKDYLSYTDGKERCLKICVLEGISVAMTFLKAKTCSSGRKGIWGCMSNPASKVHGYTESFYLQAGRLLILPLAVVPLINPAFLLGEREMD